MIEPNYGTIALNDLRECRRIPYYDASNSYCVHLHLVVEKLLKHLVDRHISDTKKREGLFASHSLNWLMLSVPHPNTSISYWQELCEVWGTLQYPNKEYRIVDAQFIYQMQTAVREFLEWFAKTVDVQILAELLTDESEDINLDAIDCRFDYKWRMRVAEQLGLCFENWLLV